MARSAKAVIDAAVEDGARWERAGFLGVIATAVVSLGVILTGAVVRDVWIAMSGAIGGAGIIGPLLAYTYRIRREIFRIRVYGIALTQARSPQEAVTILRTILDRPSKSDGKPQ